MTNTDRAYLKGVSDAAAVLDATAAAYAARTAPGRDVRNQVLGELAAAFAEAAAQVRTLQPAGIEAGRPAE